MTQFRVKTTVQVLAWVTIACFITALLWSLLLGYDLIRRSKIPKLRTLFAVISLFGISFITLGAFPLIDEAIRYRQGEPQAIDGQMYFVFCALAGFLTLLGVGIAWLVTSRRPRVPPTISSFR
jgi:drug/metabolite transporter (DMT)-like permease